MDFQCEFQWISFAKTCKFTKHSAGSAHQNLRVFDAHSHLSPLGSAVINGGPPKSPKSAGVLRRNTPGLQVPSFWKPMWRTLVRYGLRVSGFDPIWDIPRCAARRKGSWTTTDHLLWYLNSQTTFSILEVKPQWEHSGQQKLRCHSARKSETTWNMGSKVSGYVKRCCKIMQNPNWLIINYYLSSKLLYNSIGILGCIGVSHFWTNHDKPTSHCWNCIIYPSVFLLCPTSGWSDTPPHSSSVKRLHIQSSTS